MVTNDIDRRVHFTIDHWNEDKSVSNDFTIYAYSNQAKIYDYLKL